MAVRACLATDVPLDGAPWLVPDAELGEEGLSVVEEQSGRVVAAGLRRRSRSTTRFDGIELYCEDGHGAEVLRTLAAWDERRPVVLRVLPDTSNAAAVVAVGGGQVLQSVPAGAVPAGHADVQEWAGARLEEAAQAGVELRTGMQHTTDELLDLWMDAYLRMHERWAPVADAQHMREVFRRLFADTLDAGGTFVARVGGQPVAATFLNAYEGALVPLMVEVQPGHPAAETAAAASMAAMLSSVTPHPVEFEGHVDEEVYMRILETLPHRSAGRLTPMDLVQVTPTR